VRKNPPWQMTSSAWKSSDLLLILNHFFTNVFGHESFTKKKKSLNTKKCIYKWKWNSLELAFVKTLVVFFKFSSLIVEKTSYMKIWRNGPYFVEWVKLLLYLRSTTMLMMTQLVITAFLSVWVVKFETLRI